MRSWLLVILMLATSPTTGGRYAQTRGKQKASASTLQILTVDEKTYPKLLAQTKGKVKLVNFWATWCQPCVMEFPDILKLREKYQARGLEVVFISADFPDEKNGTVAKFLQKHNVNFVTYIMDVKDSDEFINSVSHHWSGAIPATFIYNRNGQLVSSLVGRKSFQEFEGAILPLIQ